MNGVMVIPAARGVVIGAAMLLLATGAQAVPLSYDEATDGDLPGDTPPILSLDVGDNIVNGASLPFDLDSFDIQIPAGQRLTTILFSITTADLALDPWVHYIFNGTSAALYLPLDGASVFISDLPLGAGTYSMFHSGAQWSDVANTYTWTFRVEAVPEPATLALLGMGMVAAGLIRRR